MDVAAEFRAPREADSNEQTSSALAEVLQGQGYVTGAFGKWGLGGPGSCGDPMVQGINRFFGYNCQAHAHSYYPPYLVRNSQEVPLKNNRGGSDGETYSHYVIFEAALEFIRSNQEQPFFCYLAINKHQ